MAVRLFRSGIVVGLLALLAGAGTVSASTTLGTATLYRATGAIVGNVRVTSSDTALQATVTLVGAQPNATYSICVSIPMVQQQGGCAPTAASTTSGGADMSALPWGTLTTDATGSGTGAITLWGPAAVVIVMVTNAVDSGDSAAAVVATTMSANAAGPDKCDPGHASL